MATDGKHDTIVQEAINRVLAAERDATQAVARCEEQAKQELEAAREAAQRVRLRARQRVVVLHEQHGRQRERRLDAHLAEGTRPRDHPDPHLEEERIRRAVAKLAAALTGSDE
ncbi:MAG TPA: hypothetical protein VIX81_10120 [Gammaproteobacteria bacterium]